MVEIGKEGRLNNGLLGPEWGGGGGGAGRCGDDTGSGDDDGIKVEVQKILL